MDVSAALTIADASSSVDSVKVADVESLVSFYSFSERVWWSGGAGQCPWTPCHKVEVRTNIHWMTPIRTEEDMKERTRWNARRLAWADNAVTLQLFFPLEKKHDVLRTAKSHGGRYARRHGAQISTHCRLTRSRHTVYSHSVSRDFPRGNSAHLSTRFPMFFRGVMTPSLMPTGPDD